MTKQELQLEVERLNFILAYVGPALGPADDEILEMAEEAWISSRKRICTGVTPTIVEPLEVTTVHLYLEEPK